ncbi:aminopeptidase P family protein [Paenibacillus rhizovicinus]|uniref:Aminopeptidase P family protein n=1 Tax=Paenibacillus rhizovicinus TaxID=2704463 RepID=A0A6C0P9Q5_9BACL|nr:Xaa-Pro peptidase family protein [Paenibacillus rhizovicinus]QHW35209.1 aminopeptidase P family protein [Paenibacillus rhizovicinus]
MDIGKVDQEEIAARVKRLQSRLIQEGVDGFLVTQHVDLYYFTGSMQAGYAFIPAEGEAVFYVRRSLERAEQESAIAVEAMSSLRGFRAQLAGGHPSVFGGDVAAAGKPIKIATEMDVLPAATFAKLAEITAGGQRGCSLIDGSSLIRSVRMIKSPWEVGRIEAAATVVAEALDAALPILKEGISELELMARIEYEMRIRGHIGLMRTRSYNMEIMTGMLGSGAAVAMPSAFDGPAGGLGLGPAAPQSASRKTILRNEPVLIDIGCCIDGYVIDQTRTAVIGGLSDELAAAYAQSERIIRHAEQLMIPGTACDAIYAASLEDAAAAGLAGHFMGFGTGQVKFLGHGIGLEVDEWPVLARGFGNPLEPGMVLAVEPKFTFPGSGVVGIENSYLITDDGCRQLTKSSEGLIVL